MVQRERERGGGGKREIQSRGRKRELRAGVGGGEGRGFQVAGRRRLCGSAGHLGACKIYQIDKASQGKGGGGF